MLSSNNRNEYLRKQEPKKQRFAIKKLTVGVASVLIGFTFMGLSASASANETTPAQPATAEASANQTGDAKKKPRLLLLHHKPILHLQMKIVRQQHKSRAKAVGSIFLNLNGLTLHHQSTQL